MIHFFIRPWLSYLTSFPELENKPFCPCFTDIFGQGIDVIRHELSPKPLINTIMSHFSLKKDSQNTVDDTVSFQILRVILCSYFTLFKILKDKGLLNRSETDFTGLLH